MALPNWLNGKHVTAITLTGQTVASDGSLTPATGAGIQSLTTIWEEIDIDNNPVTEEISASDAARTHHVKLKEDNRIRITGIMRQNVPSGAAANTKANPIAYLANTYDVIQIVVTRGSATDEDVWTFMGLRSGFSERLRNSKCVQELTLIEVDTGAANPGYA